MGRINPRLWADWRPLGIGLDKPFHHIEMVKLAWQNRRHGRYAWKVLTEGVCDGCALGVAGLHDWTMDDIHLCLTRLRLLEINTLDAMDDGALDDVASLRLRSGAELRSMGRLAHPMRRRRGERGFTRISWDEALAEIAGRWQRIIAEHGPAAILPYSYSGTIGIVQSWVAAGRFWNRLGASGLERSICDAAAGVAMDATYGAGWGPDPRDISHARMIVLWGHNPATSGPHIMPFIREAQRAGAYVVVVDPRRTLTARSADLHVALHPATDAALALGLMQVIFAEGLHDEAWLEANTVGWRELRDRAAAWTPDRVATITGVEADVIVALARRYATTKPALLKTADGVQRHGTGGQAFRAIIALPAIVGQVGTRGGGLAYSNSGHGAIAMDAVTKASQCAPQPRVINMNRLGAALNGDVDGPPIQSLFVFGANPVTSTPNAGAIVRGLLREDLFTVVHEQFMTDTAHYADIILPATTQFEQIDLHRAYGHRYITYNAPAIAPLGEAKSNWDTMRALATAMGYDEPWLHEEPDAIIAGILQESSALTPKWQGITLERLKRDGFAPLSFEATPDVPFADGIFPTPSGKLELFSERLAAQGLDPLPDYTPPAEFADWRPGSDDRLALVTGAPHHSISSSQGNQTSLMRKEGSPFVEIHPDDAAARGIADGDTVTAENARGWCVLRAVVTTDVRPGTLVSPKGRWGRLSPGGRSVNFTTSDMLADYGGQATFHSNLVRLRHATPAEIAAGMPTVAAQTLTIAGD